MAQNNSNKNENTNNPHVPPDVQGSNKSAQASTAQTNRGADQSRPWSKPSEERKNQENRNPSQPGVDSNFDEE